MGPFFPNRSLLLRVLVEFQKKGGTQNGHRAWIGGSGRGQPQDVAKLEKKLPDDQKRKHQKVPAAKIYEL